jgi:hypothetical protein
MKNTTRLAALALAVTAPLALAGQATAADTGSISGVVWHDADSNGVRDAGEAPIKGHYVVIDGTDKVVQSDDQGRYEFKNLRRGYYRVKSTDRSGWGQGWTRANADSKFRANDGGLDSPVELKAGASVTLDSGFATAKVDTSVWHISISNPTPKVGDVIDIVGSTVHNGNVYDQFGGQLTLPAGLRVVERLGGMPKYYETEPAGKVTGYFYDRKPSGLPEWVGARVVVEQPIDGEIRFEVMKGLFGSTDTDTANDTASKLLITTD